MPLPVVGGCNVPATGGCPSQLAEDAARGDSLAWKIPRSPGIFGLPPARGVRLHAQRQGYSRRLTWQARCVTPLRGRRETEHAQFVW